MKYVLVATLFALSLNAVAAKNKTSRLTSNARVFENVHTKSLPLVNKSAGVIAAEAKAEVDEASAKLIKGK